LFKYATKKEGREEGGQREMQARQAKKTVKLIEGSVLVFVCLFFSSRGKV